MSKNKIDDSILAGVVGGTNIPNDKKTAFTTAWKELGFEKEERTSHEMYELFDEWEATGYKQSAADFLAKHK